MPYLQALILAAAFAVVFRTFFDRTAKILGGRRRIAAIVTILVIGIIIFAPLSFLGFQVVREALDVYTRLSSGSGLSLDAVLNNLGSRLPVPVLQEVNLEESVKGGLAWLLGSARAFFSVTISLLLNAFIGILALYYFLIQGGAFRRWIVSFSPLPDNYDDVILNHLRTTVDSVIRGSLVIALAQGIIAGVGFAIFGVPNPALWGTVTAIAALIPGIGTAIVVLPMIIYLFATGATADGIGLTIWGVVAVGLIDNIIRPMLIKSGAKVHPLAIFISVLGGLTVFGPLGFLIGPLVMSLFFTLLDIYISFRKGEIPQPSGKS